MAPVRYTWHGLEIGDSDAAAELIGIAHGAAYQAYVRRPWVRYRKPPGRITRDGVSEGDTGKVMYPLRMVNREEWDAWPDAPKLTETLEEWQAGRLGRGNWGGDGARAHYRPRPPRARPAEKSA